MTLLLRLCRRGLASHWLLCTILCGYALPTEIDCTIAGATRLHTTTQTAVDLKTSDSFGRAMQIRKILVLLILFKNDE